MRGTTLVTGILYVRLVFARTKDIEQWSSYLLSNLSSLHKLALKDKYILSRINYLLELTIFFDTSTRFS